MIMDNIELAVANWKDPEHLRFVYDAFTRADLSIKVNEISIYDYKMYVDGDVHHLNSHEVSVWYFLENLMDRLWAMCATNDHKDGPDLSVDFEFLTTLFCEGNYFPHIKITENDKKTVTVAYNLNEMSNLKHNMYGFDKVVYKDVGFGCDVKHIVSKESFLKSVFTLLFDTAKRAKNSCELYKDELYDIFNHHETVDMFKSQYNSWRSHYKDDVQELFNNDETFPEWEKL